MVKAESRKHVWAERYDRDLADIFAVQDNITEAATIAIAPAIAAAEQRAVRMPPENLDAWAAYQRGLWHFYRISHRRGKFSYRILSVKCLKQIGFLLGSEVGAVAPALL